MLHSRTLTRAAHALVLVLWATPAAAQLGASCTPGNAGSWANDTTGNGLYCNANTNTVTYPAYWFSSTASGCSSSTAGLTQFTGTSLSPNNTFEFCNGTSWQVLGTATSVPLSGITGATAANTFDSSNYAQTWSWGTLGGNTALLLSSTDMTSGTILEIQNTYGGNSTGNMVYLDDVTTGAGTALYVLTSGANNTGYAGYFTNTSTANDYGIYSTIASVTTGVAVYGSLTSKGNTGYAGFFTNTDTGAANYGLYASTSSSSGYAGYFQGKAYVNGDINDANVTSCSNLGTDSNGKLICEGSLNLSYVSTQTANNSASLQFINLPTTYNTLFLNCSGLVGSSGVDGLNVLLGEGSTPTWKSGHYTDTAILTNASSTTASVFDGTTNFDVTTGLNFSSSNALSLSLYLYNVGSSTLPKNVTYAVASYSTNYYYYQTGSGFWNSDTNPITGIELTPAGTSPTIASGTCSLYGLNNSGGASVPLSGITGATAANTFDSSNWAQTWTWNSLAGNTALALTTTDLTSGTILQVENTSGGNSTGYAGYFENITTGAGYALYGVTTGSSNSGYGVYGIDNSASGYGGYFQNTSTGYALYASGNANITGSAQVGSTTASCASGNAGAVQYTGGLLKFCNGSAWQPISFGPGPGVLISTQTASSSASLQFTNLPTTYNTLFLNCELSLSSANGVYVYIGEGAGPTWETGAHYTQANIFINNSSGDAFAETTTGTDLTSGINATSAGSASLKLWLNNVASTTLYKEATFIGSGQTSSASGLWSLTGSGKWNNDTNPVTGLEVAGGANMTGTCSLYGMN